MWYIGGNSPLSGDVVGKQVLGERLEEFAKRSNKTFGVVTNWAQVKDVLLPQVLFQ